MRVCSSTEDEAKKQADEAKKQADEAKKQEDEAKDAERAEAERLANIPSIIVNVQCNGKPPTEVSVKPHEQVGSSMDRELKLSEKDQRVKEVWMGDVPLDIEGCYEPQGVVDEANLSALTGPTGPQQIFS